MEIGTHCNLYLIFSASYNTNTTTEYEKWYNISTIHTFKDSSQFKNK